MNPRKIHLFPALLLVACAAAFAADTPAPPKSWIDPDTGHRVIRLTDEPGSASLYFNINAYTPDGREMIYTTPGRGLGVVDLATFKNRPLVPGPVGGSPGAVVVGRKTATVYYLKGTADQNQSELWCTSIATGATRKLADLPRRGGIFSINADETLGVGSYIIGDGEDYRGRNASQQINAADAAVSKKQAMADRLAARLPMVLFTVDLATGKSRPIFSGTDWLDHLQFSTVDPTLLMYAHQGAWQQVDKLWTIRTDGSGNTQIDHRIMQMEGTGHQWWDADGNIWYDLHFPLGGSAYIAGYDIHTKQQTWYQYAPDQASIHFNRSPDGKLFCGDGGTAKDAQWVYLFRPELIPDDHSLGENLIRPGIFHAEKLVNMSKHNYRLEPNVSFSPDMKYVIFRSNMFGPTYAFAVEVAVANAK
ncbi:MAG TPA: oligogalacturonate lyase family protein [Opitutaceae bacterium]|nr:oligogalacturonate lyase family protein [Opitutaceae bacterium]